MNGKYSKAIEAPDSKAKLKGVVHIIRITLVYHPILEKRLSVRPSLVRERPWILIRCEMETFDRHKYFLELEN